MPPSLNHASSIFEMALDMVEETQSFTIHTDQRKNVGFLGQDIILYCIKNPEEINEYIHGASIRQKIYSNEKLKIRLYLAEAVHTITLI